MGYAILRKSHEMRGVARASCEIRGRSVAARIPIVRVLPASIHLRVRGTRVLNRPGSGGGGLSRAPRSHDLGFSCHGDGVGALELYGCEHAELAVSTSAVMPNFEVVEHRVGELDAGLPLASVEEFDLHA